jgi:hypothetical protein
MTSTFWPSTNSGAGCTFPQELQKSCASFERFYNTRHSGRRLTWQPALGNADVKVAFKAKKHELNVSTFALVILLLFEDLEDDDFLTYEVEGPSDYKCSISLFTGYKNFHIHSGCRSSTTFTVIGLRKVQNIEEASSFPGCLNHRLIFFQYRLLCPAS